MILTFLLCGKLICLIYALKFFPIHVLLTKDRMFVLNVCHSNILCTYGRSSCILFLHFMKSSKYWWILAKRTSFCLHQNTGITFRFFKHMHSNFAKICLKWVANIKVKHVFTQMCVNHSLIRIASSFNQCTKLVWEKDLKIPWNFHVEFWRISRLRFTWQWILFHSDHLVFLICSSWW
jgi:hypothetical protein